MATSRYLLAVALGFVVIRKQFLIVLHLTLLGLLVPFLRGFQHFGDFKMQFIREVIVVLCGFSKGGDELRIRFI